MRIKLYIDVYEGMNLKFMTAYASPCGRIEGARRYAIEFELPDHYFPDETIQITKPEEVK